jgi:hypothetical protein
MDDPLIFHLFSIDFPWIINGLSMDYPWISRARRLEISSAGELEVSRA